MERPKQESIFASFAERQIIKDTLLDGNIQQKMAIIENIDGFDDPDIMYYFNYYLQNTNDLATFELLVDKIVNRIGFNFCVSPLTRSTPTMSEKGFNILLGSNEIGQPCYLDLARCGHVLLLGPTQIGKTSALKVVLSQVLSTQLSLYLHVLLCDIEREFENLALQYLINSMNWKAMSFNPIERIEGIDYLDINNRVGSFFTDSFELREASTALWADAASSLNNIFLDNVSPNLQNLEEHLAIDSFPGHKNETRLIIRNKIKGLLGGTGNVFRVSKSMDFRLLWKLNLLMDFRGLLRSHLYFLFTSFLGRLLDIAITDKMRPDRPGLLIIVDELGKRLWPANRQWMESETAVDSVLTGLAKRGIILLMAEHSYLTLSTMLKSNIGTYICFRQVGENLRAVADALNLDPRSKDILGKLNVGQAICKTRYSPEPFLVNIADPDLFKGENINVNAG